MIPESGWFLWAVHISDSVLTVPWLIGGFVLTGGLMLAAVAIDAARKRTGHSHLDEEAIAQVALITAVFFVSSLIHVKLGPTSVHLLLNGLVGVLLGWRAALAIPVGLLLQAALIGHGGYSTLGVNSCILTVPALLAWGAWQGLHRVAWLRHPWGRGGLVAGSVMLWTLSLVFSMAMFWTNPPGPLETLETATAWRITFAPYTLASVLLLSLLAALVERRWEQAPEFPLGLLIGTTAVLATMLGNSLVLLWGGQEDWHTLVLLVLVAHMPIAVLEGVVLGFTVGFLARVKPEMLGWRLAGQAKQTLNLAPENRQCTVDSLS